MKPEMREAMARARYLAENGSLDSFDTFGASYLAGTEIEWQAAQPWVREMVRSAADDAACSAEFCGLTPDEIDEIVARMMEEQ